MLAHFPIVLREQADLRGLGGEVGIAATKADDARQADVEVLRRVVEEFELRIERVRSPDRIFLERHLRADLDQMIAVPVDVGETQIIAEGDAALLHRLEIGSPAELDERIVEAEPGILVAAECEFRFEEIDRRFVEQPVAAIGVAQLGGVDVVVDLGSLRPRRGAAEVAQVGFLADAAAQLELLVFGHLQRQLAEAQLLAERADIAAGIDLRVEIDEVGLRPRAARIDGADAVLGVGFVGAEEEQLVADDRPAKCDAVLVALERLFRIVVLLLEKVALDHLFVLVADERLAVEVVGARFGDGGDDRRPGVLELGLEVGTQHAEFLDRELREGIAAADVLADDPALIDVALQADAVDEHVDLRPAGALAVLVGADAAAGKGLAEVGLVDPDPRRERGEVDEVAVVLRQILDLLLRHVGADFRRPRLDQPAADDDDRGAVAGRRGGGRCGIGIGVERRGLPDFDRHSLARRSAPLRGEPDVIGSGAQPGQNIAPVGASDRVRRRVGLDIYRRDHRARRGRRTTRHHTTDG